MKAKGLGRGLDALLGGDEPPREALATVETATIRPGRYQPRTRMDEQSLAELAQSIRSQGLLQPLVVRPLERGYELIAGERRWRAARQAEVETVPALVREADDRDSLLLALVENVAREQLSAVEEARAYAVLLDEFGLSLGDVAERVGRSKPSVSNRLRLLELPDDVLWMLARGELTEGHARAVLAVPDHDARRRLARRIARDGLSVRAAERAAQASGARRRARATPVHPHLAERARAAAERLTGRRARVRAGRLEIDFADEHELAELVEALERHT